MKILLVDDHPIFLEGLRNLLLARGIDVVDTANSGEEALKKVRYSLPDVVLMDIKMKPLSGLQTTRFIKEQFPEIKIIMLTASETEEDIFEAVKSGASGYLLKSLDADVLFKMLTHYESRETTVSLVFPNEMLDKFRKNDDMCTQDDLSINKECKDRISKLSQRQKDVLILSAKGMKYKDIAIRLGVTERTIKYYMEMILDNLHMENRSQAIKCIIQEGMVD